MEENTTPLVENGSDNTNHDENHVKETKYVFADLACKFIS